MPWKIFDTDGSRLRESFTRYAGDGRNGIDNNPVERSPRGIAITRKNFLFFLGSEAGGGQAAMLYTMLESAKLNGLDPEAYLADVIDPVAKGHPFNGMRFGAHGRRRTGIGVVFGRR